MTTNTTTTTAVEVVGLTKSYGAEPVLDGVDLRIPAGTVLALLGSNGAGKTTVVRILSTLLRADGGSVAVNGYDVATQPAQVRASMSLTGQQAAVDGMLTGRENRHILRSPDTIITTAVTPVALLALFVYVLGGAIRVGDGQYVNYLLPGILLITVASGIAYTAFRLFTDTSTGVFERFQSMPVTRSALLWAHVLTSLIANVISLAARLVRAGSAPPAAIPALSSPTAALAVEDRGQGEAAQDGPGEGSPTEHGQLDQRFRPVGLDRHQCGEGDDGGGQQSPDHR